MNIENTHEISIENQHEMNIENKYEIIIENQHEINSEHTQTRHNLHALIARILSRSMSRVAVLLSCGRSFRLRSADRTLSRSEISCCIVMVGAASLPYHTNAIRHTNTGDREHANQKSVEQRDTHDADAAASLVSRSRSFTIPISRCHFCTARCRGVCATIMPENSPSESNDADNDSAVDGRLSDGNETLDCRRCVNTPFRWKGSRSSSSSKRAKSISRSCCSS